MLQIWNTLSRKKEPLPDQNKLRLFVCGPTVYDYAHIGHARTYIFFDFFARYLRSRGYDVSYLQNITDIDDRIIARAAEAHKTPAELAEFFTKAYLDDMRSLGVSAVTEYAPATKFISQIVAQVERLVDKGHAYKIDGDGWYFDIARFPDYGKLSGRTALQAEDAVSRIDESVGKKNKGDFCLWKFSKPGEPVWSAPIGNGRPGWHIEDTAISEFYFGPQYEIHGGGVDLKFPHHEAEIAQQESASGKKPFVQLWMHTGALLADGRKMSKSLGNFITVRDFLKEHSPDVLRFITLTHHYRSPVDFSEGLVQQAEAALENMHRFWGRLHVASREATRGSGRLVKKTPAEAGQKFQAALEDDVNSATAIAELFKQVMALQPQVKDIPDHEALTRFKYFDETLKFLGFSFEMPGIPENVEKLAGEREQCRVNKQFEESDALRKKINGLGYDIEDTPKGPFLWPRTKKRS